MTNLTQNKGDNVKLVKYHANLTPDNLVEVESEDIKNSSQTFSLTEKIKNFSVLHEMKEPIMMDH